MMPLLLALLSSLPSAHAASLDADGLLWLQSVTQGKIHGDVLGHVELQPRLTIDSEGFQALIARFALGYQLTPELSVHPLGWAWQPSFAPKYKNENRVWQQLAYSQKHGHFEAIHRFRQEQRLIQNAADVSHRSRYQLRLTQGLDDANDLRALLADEVFFNLNSSKGGPQSGFDQNRLFLGVNKSLVGTARFDLVYQLQYVNRPNPTVNARNHGLLFTLYTYF